MSDTNVEPTDAPPDLGALSGASQADDLGALASAGGEVSAGAGVKPPKSSAFDALIERTSRGPDPAVQQQFVDLKAKQIEAFQRQQANEQRLETEDRARVKQAFEAEQATIDHTPKWDAEAERAKYRTDPIQEFGSLGSVFAMVASAFTRAPMINALNGAAAAINAKRDSNEKEYDRALEAFKVNSDLVIKRFNMQHTALGDAFTLMDRDANRGHAKLLEEMTKYGMEKELMLYQNGMIPEIQQADAGQLKAIEGIMRLKNDMDKTEEVQRHNKEQEWIAAAKTLRPALTPRHREILNSDPQFNGADPEGKVNAFIRVMNLESEAQKDPGIKTSLQEALKANAQATPEDLDTVLQQRFEAMPRGLSRTKADASEVERRTLEFERQGMTRTEANDRARKEVYAKPDKGLTANQRVTLQKQVSQYEQELSSLDRAIKLIEKKGGVGLGGKIKRPLETASNVLGGSNSTEMRQVQELISELRLRAPALLTQSGTSTPRLRSAYELVNNIVPGLELGASAQSVLDQFRSLKEKFTTMRDETKSYLDGPSAKPAAPAADAPPKVDFWLRDKK